MYRAHGKSGTDQAMELYRTHSEQKRSDKNNAWSVFKKVAPPLVAAGAAVVAAPHVLSAAGFGPEGIERESIAANSMSATARSNGKGVSVRSFFSACQSAGVVGISKSTLVGIGLAAGIFTALVQKEFNDDTDEDDESGNVA